MEFGKRKRSSNFVSHEKRLLCRIMEKYLYIIENKKTDGATNKLKEAAWEKLTTEFNRETTCDHRTGRSLKQFYENHKRKMREGLINPQQIDSEDDIPVKKFNIQKQEPHDDEQAISESDLDNADFITGDYLTIIADETNESHPDAALRQKIRPLIQQTEATSSFHKKRLLLVEQELKHREEQHKYNVELVKLKIDAQKAKILYYTKMKSQPATISSE